MLTFLEALYKAPETITFGWKPEPYVVVSSYNIYVSQINSYGSMTLLYSGISAQVSKIPSTLGKVNKDALIADVRTVLGLSATTDFSNKLLYWTLTYDDETGTESTITDSRIVEVPPVGILGKTMKEDPTINRHEYVFTDELQRWIKMAGSGSGAVITDSADFYKANITTEYTYDGTDLSTAKSYPSDSTSPGSPAKLTTYTYSGGLLTKVTVTDSTI